MLAITPAKIEGFCIASYSFSDGPVFMVFSNYKLLSLRAATGQAYPSSLSWAILTRLLIQ